MNQKLVRLLFASFVWLAASCAFAADDPPLDPIPREVVARRVVAVYDFQDGATSIESWTPGPTVKLSRNGSSLVARSTESDPYFFSPELGELNVRGEFLVKLTARRTTT